MPDVTIRRNPGYISDDDVKHLSKALQNIVAKALFVSRTAELTKDDIVVRDMQHGPNDIGTLDLEITITTNDLPERKVNLQERTEQIAKTVRSLRGLGSKLKADRNYVWVVLVPGGFKIF